MSISTKNVREKTERFEDSSEQVAVCRDVNPAFSMLTTGGNADRKHDYLLKPSYYPWIEAILSLETEM